MAKFIPAFIWIPELLAKAIIKRSVTSSIAAAMLKATIQRNYSAYVIKVLEASPSIRSQVREAAISDIETSNSEGLKQLVCILTMFELLPPTKKAEFIDAYKGAATLAGQGTIEVVREITWQNNHVPPYVEP